MTREQVWLGRRIVSTIAREIALTDRQLAGRLKVTTAELRPVLGALYGQRRIDFAVGYVFLTARAGQEARAA